MSALVLTLNDNAKVFDFEIHFGSPKQGIFSADAVIIWLMAAPKSRRKVPKCVQKVPSSVAVGLNLAPKWSIGGAFRELLGRGWLGTQAQNQRSRGGGGVVGEERLSSDKGRVVEVSQQGRTREVGGRSHALRTRGSLTWCDVCGAYSHVRAGNGIKGHGPGTGTRHRVTRLSWLGQGRHPITNESLV